MSRFKHIDLDEMRACADRFWQKVDKTGDGCWNWMAAIKNNGYGYFRISATSGMIGAHKAAWVLSKGLIPEGLYVCHSCDNRRCCNPAHLWLGNHQQNQKDMAAKKRVFSPAKKLTDAEIADIRSMLVAGSLQREIAEKYQIAQAYVSRIKNNRARS